VAVEEHVLQPPGIEDRIDQVSLVGFSKLVEGLRIEPDEKPWYG
jgi:hypothetical protein